MVIDRLGCNEFGRSLQRIPKYGAGLCHGFRTAPQRGVLLCRSAWRSA
jgi:hypothetical protein